MKYLSYTSQKKYFIGLLSNIICMCCVVNMKSNPSIKVVDSSKIHEKSFKRNYVGCIVFTKDRKILLQQRPENWRTFPGCLATFGGEIESGELPLDALQRELKEELGAILDINNVISLGSITEAITNYSELIYAYFWHDKNGTITGCYECKPKYYDTVSEALTHTKIMEDVKWMLKECQKLKPIQ